MFGLNGIRCGVLICYEYAFPELYRAYIGVAQMSHQLKSEILAYDYMLKQFKANGNAKMARKLEAAPVTLTDGTPQAYLVLRDIAMHGLGIGTMDDLRSVVTGIFLPSLLCRDYTLGEKLNLWRAKAASPSRRTARRAALSTRTGAGRAHCSV